MVHPVKGGWLQGQLARAVVTWDFEPSVLVIAQSLFTFRFNSFGTSGRLWLFVEVLPAHGAGFRLLAGATSVGVSTGV